jgi:hypothetical protein
MNSDKRSKSHAVVQGRFKTRLPFAAIHTGLAYDQPLERLPTQWSLLRISIQLLSRLQPGSRTSLRTQCPYVLIPLMAVAQNIGRNNLIYFTNLLILT